jgi:hypothetical protein
MYIEINNVHDFKRQFFDKQDAFTYEGFEALYQHFEDLGDFGGEAEIGVKVVPSDLCVLWTEYTQGEFLVAYTSITAEEIAVMSAESIDKTVTQFIAEDKSSQVFLRTPETVLVGTYE